MGETMKMFEVKQYTDEEGKLIMAKVPLDSTYSEFDKMEISSKPEYSGTFMVTTQRGPIKMEFPFPEGWDLEKCFTEFEKEAKSFFEELQKQAREEAKSRIVVPGQQQGGGLIVPQ